MKRLLPLMALAAACVAGGCTTVGPRQNGNFAAVSQTTPPHASQQSDVVQAAFLAAGRGDRCGQPGCADACGDSCGQCESGCPPCHCVGCGRLLGPACRVGSYSLCPSCAEMSQRLQYRLNRYDSVYRFNPGPPVGQTAYPYYTIHGPRDFLRDNPPPLGPY